MGCVNSKRVARRTTSAGFKFEDVATVDNSVEVVLRSSPKNQSAILATDAKSEDRNSRELKKSKRDGSNGKGSFSFKLGFNNRSVAAEHTAAGWPSWLSAYAGEAIHGWLPLIGDSFEKMDKVSFKRIKLSFYSFHLF